MIDETLLKLSYDPLEILLAACSDMQSVKYAERGYAIRKSAERLGVQELESINLFVNELHEGERQAVFTLEGGGVLEPAGSLYVGCLAIRDEWGNVLHGHREKSARALLGAGFYYERGGGGMAFGGVPIRTNTERAWQSLHELYWGK